MELRVIDVSEHQGVINWDKVKNSVDGVILRCGYGDNVVSQDDKQWKRNADECTRLGIPFGVYIYSYATSIEQARSEAEHVLRLIKGYKLSYPVYLDLEQQGTEYGAIQRANTFGDIIEKSGYWCGIYANTNWWTNYLVGLERFVKWVAQYNTTCEYTGKYDMWQYTSKGSVNGIISNVDMNVCYRNYPSEINGNSSNPILKSEDTIVNEVLKGLWGNGEDRKNRLTNCGYNYSSIQSKVNELLTQLKSNETIANEVIRGLWGNGEERKNRLTNAGYNYTVIQSIVDRMLS
jgi:lysozyme|nr:MAG TPA: PlyB like endolysin [Caudoviricetes sp.]